MKSLKHIFGLLMMGAMIIAAGCNKEENGGKKENLPHPNSTYKACPILAHFGNEKLGIKEINMNNGEIVYYFDKEQRIIKMANRKKEYNLEYKYDTQGKLVSLKDDDIDGETNYIISYDAYGFVDSIIFNYTTWTFKYSYDTVFIEEFMDIDEGKNGKYICKFSDDLYLTYLENVDDGSWEKYIWKNGNMVSNYNNKGEKWDYQYDNSPNINRLKNSYFVYVIGIYNNTLIHGNTYTYNEKGLLETISSKDENGVEEVWRTYNYIYY